MAILLKIVERALRRIDRYVGEIRSPQALHLGIEVGKIASLQQRVVSEIDPGNNIVGAERHLLGLGEEVVNATVEDEPPDPPDRHLFFRYQFGRVQHIEVKRVGKLFIKQLKSQFPLRKVAGLYGVPQVPSMEIRIRAIDFDGFIPHYGLHAQLRLPVEIDERALSIGGDQPERVHAETFHEAEGTGNGAVRHGPHDHVHTLGHERDKIPEVVVRRLGLWEIAIGFWFGGVNQIGKLDRILDEEHRDVVAYDVLVSLPGIEFYCESANVAC